MRPLNIINLELHEFFNKDIPPYAILSHRWEAEEVSFRNLISDGTSKPRSAKARSLYAAIEHKRGYSKIRPCCAQAKKDDHKRVWIDTCCINKESSTELSEAINSMYRWYGKVKFCYTYLSDVYCPVEDYGEAPS
jgi:Heterokaryon incompatibility protein (HET)